MKLPKNYEPNQYEADIYALWEKSRVFEPKDRGAGKSYCIVMPPPNANGDLHMGHALTNALEDISARYHRMKGEKTLLLPGADHAGFETQSVYEKILDREGKSRFDFSRDELYSRIYDFVSQNRDNFEKQYRELGVSCDWSRFTFTLDEKIVRQAYKTFNRMWDDGLIYRGERLVNYCTFHRTGFADIEVVYEEAKSPLYYLKYGPFELATTRPETKFGDTAVAVHPNDSRYKKYVGKTIEVDGVNGPFSIQVVADEMVDREFGTGVVKITPAHDFNDWEVAQRHNLPAVKVISHDGTMNERAGKFRGLTVPEAREQVVKALKEKNLLIKIDKDYRNRVGKCYKCGTVIEPMLLDQWFIDVEKPAALAIKALKSGKIKFHPTAKLDQLLRYLEGLRDWNISRQIAWGIPIPAFQNIDDPEDWIYDERTDEKTIAVGDRTYRRDPDVFDTWFSSSSWPYGALNYPDSEDFSDFYPNSLMETGGEILYPWVSRMIMLGLYETGEIPFEEVYIHGYVMAEDGSKMSKSVGNVVDPMPVVKKYGSDALRMGIIAGRAPAVNRGYDSRRVEEARNFCNKLWNMARFVEDKIGSDFGQANPIPETLADHWILHQTNNAVQAISAYLDEYRFSEAYDHLYHFLWDDLADWYIESSKIKLNASVVSYCLENTLKLAHPFAPFVTETIWQTLHPEDQNLLIISAWPTHSDQQDSKKVAQFRSLQQIIREVRQIKTVVGFTGGVLAYQSVLIEENRSLVLSLAKLEELKKDSVAGVKLLQTKEKVWLEIDKQAASDFLEKQQQKIKEIENNIRALKSRLNNSDYIKKAPASLVNESREQLAKEEKDLSLTREQIKQFSNFDD